MNPFVARMLFGELPGPVAVGRVRESLANRYGAEDNVVWLSRDTLFKQLRKHPEVMAGQYEDLTWLLRGGEHVPNGRANCFHLFDQNHVAENGTRWHATIKLVSRNRRLMLLSLYRMNLIGYRRIIRRAEK